MTHRRPPCRRCGFIRLYLMVALPLIGLMALAPEGLDRLGPALPTPEVLAVLLCLGGTAVFVVRLVRWHRDGRP